MNKLFILFFIIGGILFLTLCTNASYLDNLEPFDNIQNPNQNNLENTIQTNKPIPQGSKIPFNQCPNVLVQKDNLIYLFNSYLARINGINPIIFKNIQDYVNFVRWQKTQNINCPILFLQHTFDTQNNSVFSVAPNPFSQPDVSFYNETLNRNGVQHPSKQPLDISNFSIHGFDPQDQKIGRFTILDKIFSNSSPVSANAMDTNWGGKRFTNWQIDAGKFADREVFRFDAPKIYDRSHQFRGTGTANAMKRNWMGPRASQAMFP